MEYEFDKEIDALLRRTAAGEAASADIDPKSAIQNLKSIHLDADEISAFAENALPERLKRQYTAHFADCDRCRTILSNTMALDAEAENKTAFPVAAPEIAAVSIPRHRKFFAFPRLAYALGALIVLFGGFFAFLVVRNADDAPGSADVSQISEKQPNAGGPSFDEEPQFPALNEMSNAMSANTASNMMMSSNSGSVSTTNSAASVSANSAALNSNANSSAAKTGLPKEAPAENERATDQKAAKSRADTETIDVEAADAPQPTGIKNRSADRLLTERKPEVEQGAPLADSAALSARNTTSTAEKVTDSKKAKAQTSKPSGTESRQIGGTTFTRKQGVWYDANYNGQATKNVSRGSDDYKKLDSGLRSITDNLGGTVVIIWKGETYRIQ